MYVRMTPREAQYSWILGLDAERPLPPVTDHPRVALQEVVLSSMAGARPCFVSFSGGRDSSVILAVATHVARIHGLPDPVPVTEVHQGDGMAEESEWQELVVHHLRLQEWIRLPHATRSDLLGPRVQSSLRHRGLLWPPAIHLAANVLDHVRGGALLTGQGGDEFLGAHRITPLRVLLKDRRWLGRAHAVAIAIAVAPTPLRRRHLARVFADDGLQAWLRPDAREQHFHRVAADLVSEPLGWDASVRWLRRRRSSTVMAANHRALATEHDVSILDPLAHDAFLSALAAWGGRWGTSGRTTALRALVGDLLPDSVLDRRSKALFNSAYFGPESREFARTWDGTGFDPGIVNAEALRREWLSPSPSAMSTPLLHSAWLSTVGTTSVTAA